MATNDDQRWQLDDEQQMLLMAYADGELDDDASLRAQVEGWLAEMPALRGAVTGQRALRATLREAVFAERQLTAKQEDALSMTRGRVLTRLPAEPRPAVVESEPAAWSGLFGWIASFGWGRVAFAGAAVAAAVLLVVALRSPHQGQLPGEPNLSAQADPGEVEEPEVIIEDMEIDSGTIVVDPSRRAADGPVIIWHLEEDAEPAQDPAVEGEG